MSRRWQGNTGWTVGLAVGIAPIWPLLVTGHSAVVPAGTEYRAFTSAPVPFSIQNRGGQLALNGVAPTSVSGAELGLNTLEQGRRAAHVQMAASSNAPGIQAQ